MTKVKQFEEVNSETEKAAEFKAKNEQRLQKIEQIIDYSKTGNKCFVRHTIQLEFIECVDLKEDKILYETNPEVRKQNIETAEKHGVKIGDDLMNFIDIVDSKGPIAVRHCEYSSRISTLEGMAFPNLPFSGGFAEFILNQLAKDLNEKLEEMSEEKTEVTA